MMRAIKGAAEIVSGTIEAVVPIEEPTKKTGQRNDRYH